MARSQNRQKFYKDVDAMSVRLREEGMEMDAELISHMLHKVAWTTGTELLEYLESTFKDLLSSPKVDQLSARLREELRTRLEWIENS
jgi:hypothetical protein